MTKRFLSRILFALLLGSAGLHAQTLTEANSAPAIGHTTTVSTFSLSFPNDFTERQSGSGVTWDLSGVGTGSSNSTTYQTPSGGSVASDYPSSNMLSIDASTGGETYMAVGATGWNIQGTYGASFGQQQFSADPREFMVYPFSLGDSETFSFNGTFDNFVTPLIPRGGSQKLECDGIGTLILPSGTVENCIRVLATSNYDDDFGVISLNYIDSIWLWFRPGTRDYIATISLFYLDGVYTLGAGSIRANSEIMPTTGGVAPGFEAAHAVTLAPNPALDRIHLSGARAGSTLELFGMDGRMLQAWTLEENNPWLQLPTGMAPGSYALRLTGEGRIQRMTLIKQ